MWTVSNRTDRAHKNVDHSVVNDKGAWQCLRSYCAPIYHCGAEDNSNLTADSGIARLSSKKKTPLKRA